jgi:glycosyltransferase involved in cell wall biosynthesis
MFVSVVVKTRNEAARLRLTLTALSRQTIPLVTPGPRPAPAEGPIAEVIVVNDGSTDRTPAVLDETAGWLPLRVLHHEQCRGRSAASNAGARLASGDVLLFLDGDTLPAPDCLGLHARAHAAGAAIAGRGEQYNLRCTRFFEDPETGSPQPGQEEHVRRLAADLDRQRVTRRQIIEDFPSIERRAQPGIYPGAGPRLLAERELDALQHYPDLNVLWMAACGHNLSIRRQDFAAAGGFDERLTINEHRELALRLQETGVRLALVSGARTYHLTHRTGWRNPLDEPEQERIFQAAHPCLAVKLMTIFWRSLAGDESIPVQARITSLAQLDAVVRNGTLIDYDTLLRQR